MSKVIQNKGGIGVGAPYDLPGYEYDPVNDTFKDLESGKVFSKEYVAQNNGTGTETSTIKLEDNKTTIIDVSQYTDPVEVIPTQGKDGMKKVTITLDNIPSGSATLQLYAWKDSDDHIAYTLTPNPQNGELAFYDFDLTTKVTNQSFDIWGTDGSSYINWDEWNLQRDSSLDTAISGPCLLSIDSNSVLPVGQVLYGGSEYNLNTDGTSSVNELFNTTSFSPTYTGTMGNVHFFYPYSG